MVDPASKDKDGDTENPCCIDDLDEMELNAFGGYLKTLGKYYNERDFKNTPPEFLPFAIERWQKYAVMN